MAFPLALMSMANGVLGGSGGNAQNQGGGLMDSLNKITNLFANKPNPNDWMGWDDQDRRFNAPLGMGAMNWVNQDGSSVENEAANIISYVKSKGTVRFILDVNRAWPPQQQITPQKLESKLRRGGFPEIGQQLAQRLQNVLNGKEEGSLSFATSNTPALANSMFSTDASGIDYENGNLQSSFMANQRPQNNASQNPQTLPSLNNPFDWKLIIAVLVSIAITVIAVSSKK